MAESIGKRIALLQKQFGLTQEALSERVAISRVAISHIEMDLSIPSERTITLIAGLFKISPPELVKDTSYPQSKAERLPWDTCCYTKLELELELLETDLDWLGKIQNLGCDIDMLKRLKKDVRGKWIAKISEWESEYHNGNVTDQIRAARKYLLKLTTNL